LGGQIDQPCVFFRTSFKIPVDPSKQGVFFSAARFNDQSAEGRAEGQGYDSRDQYCYRDGNGKLAIHDTGNTRQKRNRHEDGCQHQGGANQGAGQFAHGPASGVAGIKPFFLYETFNAFDDHNGVIDHDTDSQYESQ